jgi:Transglycosylase-like domain
MLQTILTTALSAQLIQKSSVTPTPPVSRVEYTQVLQNENYVSYAVEQNNTSYSFQLKKLNKPDILPLPKPQKDIVPTDQLQIPTAGASASPTIINMQIYTEIPAATPTPQPMAVPTVVESTATQVPSPVAPTNYASSFSDEVLTDLGNCEAGMDPARNSGNGYYGAFQFSYGTWKSLNTGYERADLAPLSVQEAAVRQLLQRSSIYHQFPGCAYKLHQEGAI